MGTSFWYVIMSIIICTTEINSKNVSEHILEEKMQAYLTKDTVSKVANTADQFGRTLEYLIIADVHKVKKIKKASAFLKRGRWVLKLIPQLSAISSTVGFMLKIGLIFDGEHESEMMTKMKRSFNKVNEKLDQITSDLQETRSLIKLSTQRAAYVQAESRVMSAHENLEKYFVQIGRVTCRNAMECKRTKLLIAESYLPRFNVKREVDMILRGATSDGIFGDSILYLTKEQSKCNVGQIISVASLVAGLAAKGQIAAMFYEILTNPSFDVLAFETDFQQQLVLLDRKKKLLLRECYGNIDKYLRSDVKELNAKYLPQNNAKEANKIISDLLMTKYFWMRIYIITVKLEDKNTCRDIKPFLWTNKAIIETLSERDYNGDFIFSFVLIGSFDEVVKKSLRLKWFRAAVEWTEIIRVKNSWTTAREFNFDEFSDNLSYDVKNNALVLLRYCHNAVVSYSTANGTIHQQPVNTFTKINTSDLFFTVKQNDRYQNTFNGWYTDYDTTTYAMALVPTRNEKIVKCTRDCSLNGICEIMPYSTKMFCFCNEGFYGPNCKSTIGKRKFTSDYDKILKVSSDILPTTSNVKAELEKTHTLLVSNFETSKSQFKAIIGRVSQSTTNMVENINTNQNLKNLVIQYGEALQGLGYYHHVLLEYESLHEEENPLLKEELMSFARSITHPDKLEKYLQMLTYLFVGRHDTALINHRSLIFEEMEKNKAVVCSESYKASLDHAFELLVTLQLQSYLTWLHAYDVLDMDTSLIYENAKLTTEMQKKYLDSNNCEVNIIHSTNLENCRGGYYIYNGMKIDPACKDAFYLGGMYIEGLSV